MEIKRYEGNGRMSKAVQYEGVLYLSGQICNDKEKDVQEQTKVIISQIESLLEANNSDKNKILSATIYFRDIKDYEKVNVIWDSWITQGNEPARTCVEACLANDAVLVEITVVAAVG